MCHGKHWQAQAAFTTETDAAPICALSHAVIGLVVRDADPGARRCPPGDVASQRASHAPPEQAKARPRDGKKNRETLMITLWEEFRNGGWMNWFILLFGLAGAGIALISLVLAAMRSRAALPVGIAAVAVGAWIAGLGLLGTYTNRRVVDDALASGGITPSQVERIRRVGYEEARSCATFGLRFAALPLAAGAIAIAVGLSRRRTEAEPPPTPWVSPTSPSDSSAIPSFYAEPAARAPQPPRRPRPSAVGPAIVLGIAAATVGASFVVLSAPLPGRDIAPNDALWAIEDAAHVIREGDLEDGCKRLEDLFSEDNGHPSTRPKPSEVPADIAAQCVDHRLEEALDTDPEERRPQLALLQASKLPKTAEQTRKIDQEIARLAERPEDPSEPETPEPETPAPGTAAPHATANGPAPKTEPAKVGSGSPGVSGRLPPEVIRRVVQRHLPRIRLCYENGLKKNPDLKGKVVVKFVIGRDGSVSTASGAGSDMPDVGVVSCVVTAVRGMSFPQPEGGIVTVTYPFSFASAK
jgi:hypothetical protein